MGGMLAGLVLGDAEAERRKVDAGEHRLALPQHHRRYGKVQFVDQAGAIVFEEVPFGPFRTGILFVSG